MKISISCVKPKRLITMETTHSTVSSVFQRNAICLILKSELGSEAAFFSQPACVCFFIDSDVNSQKHRHIHVIVDLQSKRQPTVNSKKKKNIRQFSGGRLEINQTFFQKCKLAKDSSRRIKELAQFSLRLNCNGSWKKKKKKKKTTDKK